MQAPPTIDLTPFQQPLDKARTLLNRIILGKSNQIDLAICCLIAEGHLLIEDLPGVGKTTLALALAKIFGLNFKRIQFTSDLLPADILGVSIFDQQNQQFKFHAGPVFSQSVLADEINRATPKTQSALLEAMEEQQISIDSEVHLLPKPFFVIGTQNPIDQAGTYPLPESQLDRFMMRIKLGYPNDQAEFNLYTGNSTRDLIQQVNPVISNQMVLEMQAASNKIFTSEPLIQYIQKLIHATRDQHIFSYGLSPRAGLSIVKASKSWALLQNRNYVEPDDVKAVFSSIASHRLMPLEQHSQGAQGLVQKILDTTAIP
ncbi:MAG: MoxR family ATPase [Gammaproteobacteria bacterium]|nr:MoxR family ATPase [Gammaproteobacteria bacterium]